MAKNEENKLEEYENTEEMMTVTVTLQDNTDVDCAVVSIFTVGERDYIALLPLDENGEGNEEGDVWFYGYSENPDDPNEEPELYNIEDDEEYEAVLDAFDEMLDNAEFDEIIE
ncbi:MAG: DUF1292 domain-containing protein [Lachnospiraceae bacterium]|nr:DUF1292 domain-containing protein [Lachnospiraceae bacterium]